MTVTQSRPRGGTPGARARWAPGRWAAALVGLVAVAGTIAIAELLAALGQWVSVVGVASSPLDSLGSGFIVLTPEWLKELAIHWFGTHDKDALRVSTLLVMAALAAGVGLLARRSTRAAVAATALLVTVTLVAIWSRTGSTVADGLPIVIGALLGIMLLTRAFRTAPAPATPGEPQAPADAAARNDLGRRGFFRITALAAGAAAVAGAVARWVPSTAQVLASRARVALPAALTRQVIPRSTDIGVNGATPYIVPTADFYRIDTALAPPRLTTDQWALRIHGMVDKEITLDYAGLRARPQIERAITLTCVSNEVGGDLAGNALWIGTRIDSLLAEAGPQQGADCVLCTSRDGFTSSTPLEALTDGRDALLAVAMNGEPLPIEHGFPVRMVVPGLYGYVSATKWVVEMEVTRFANVSAYWTSRGWSDHGPVKTASRIDVPKHKTEYPVGHQVTFAGTAWAQHRGIESVEVQIDDGPWTKAELADAVSKDTWRQWRHRWTAVRGTHVLRCRATDGTGATQTSTEAPVLPDGATGWDAITFDVV